MTATGNANFAWVQHFIHHLSPTGIAGFVLANGSMSSNTSGEGGKYEDVPGFCMAVKLDEIRKHGHILTPGRYVGAEEVEDDSEPFEEKNARLTVELAGQFRRSRELEREIGKNLAGLGFKV